MHLRYYNLADAYYPCKGHIVAGAGSPGHDELGWGWNRCEAPATGVALPEQMRNA